MTSTLRHRFAAALLLSPIAALVVQPAFAQDRRVFVQPAVVAHPAVVAPAPVFTAPVYTPPVFTGHDDPSGHDGWRHHARHDGIAPTIGELTPEPGDRVGGHHRTTVSARFSDEGSGVDIDAVRLHIDGRDVTPMASVDADEVRFREELAPGRHVAEVFVRDRAGNITRRAWPFLVAERGHGRWER